MATIKRFEDLQSWQAGRMLTNLIYDVTTASDFGHDFELKDQIRSAAGSVMHNIAEGFDSGSNVEFTRFLRIARRSASEVQSQLYLALDRSYISQNQFDLAYEKATDIKKLINGFITYLSKNRLSHQRTKKSIEKSPH